MRWIGKGGLLWFHVMVDLGVAGATLGKRLTLAEFIQSQGLACVA